MITILVDDRSFVFSNATLKKTPDFVITRLLNAKSTVSNVPNIIEVIDDKTYRIDTSIDTFSKIAEHLRKNASCDYDSLMLTLFQTKYDDHENIGITLPQEKLIESFGNMTESDLSDIPSFSQGTKTIVVTDDHNHEPIKEKTIFSKSKISSDVDEVYSAFTPFMSSNGKILDSTINSTKESIDLLKLLEVPPQSGGNNTEFMASKQTIPKHNIFQKQDIQSMDDEISSKTNSDKFSTFNTSNGVPIDIALLGGCGESISDIITKTDDALSNFSKKGSNIRTTECSGYKTKKNNKTNKTNVQSSISSISSITESDNAKNQNKINSDFFNLLRKN